MNAGERQVATQLSEIRRDHVARYEWAVTQLQGCETVIDIACGVGYGSNVLANAGHVVSGFDIDRQAIMFARKHWDHDNLQFDVQDASELPRSTKYDAAVSFETIEHIEDPRPLLRRLRRCAGKLITSVPNEEVFPYNKGILYHHRHYTTDEFIELLAETGWRVTALYGQEGPESEVEPDVQGRTLIATCEPLTVGHVAILGLGPSLDEYSNITRRLGDRHQFCDQTWGINAVGAVYQCDRVFHMDDVRIQKIRADANPKSNIAAMLDWLQRCEVPVVTSQAHPDFPMLEEFPLDDVLQEFDSGYFNSTAAYAVAYALFMGATQISIFGCDYTYPNAHQAEKGRACLEFWLGMAAERGVKIQVPKNTSLLDALHTQAERFYGYDCFDLDIGRDANGEIMIRREPVKELPTAQEIEAAYDHGKHPNKLVS